MIEEADAFGHALVDWAEGGDDPEIIEREDGFVETGAGPGLYLAEFRQWPGAERQAMRYARGRVVDVGCGAGRVALHLQRRGLDVVGMDDSALAIRAARRLGVTRTWRSSVEGLAPRVASFDTIVMFGNNFGIFGSSGRIQRALREWAGRAAPGTRILAESTNPYHGGAPALDRLHRGRNRERGLMPGQVRLRIRYRSYASAWFDWLFVSPAEMRRLLKGTGWRQVRVLGADPVGPFVAVLERD